ncbi:MAG: sugar phosphate isomerase/epimerase [Deltaproteobacteria bacterium]|nr:sugar phosphate isomerase/epimerase [Deltaproteobacteria bacterium]
MKNKIGRAMPLGMHTYTLHLSGFGESWGFEGTHVFEKVRDIFWLMDRAAEWGLDGLHVTKVDLEPLTPEFLAKVKAEAKAHDLYLELNVSFNAPSDPRVNSTVEGAYRLAEQIGADLVKFSLDIERPRPLYGTLMHPKVMTQLADRYEKFLAAIPLMEELDLTVSIENHCDTYAQEVIWLVEKLDHPSIGVCVDTINSLCVLEGPEIAVEKLLPYANSCHLCDNELRIDHNGTHSIGVPIGTGDIDCALIVRQIREKSPRMKRITLENECEVGDLSMEQAREKEIEYCVKTINYLRDELGLGVRGR